jgi:endonuclease YncB( thermonuclease family)
MPRRRSKGCLVVGLLLLVFAGVGLVIGPPQSARESSKAATSQQPAERPSRREAAPVPVSSDRLSSVRRDNAKQLQVRVVGVHDGDTLTGLNDNKEQFKVRLDAIDAPELGQPFGQASKRALSEKVFGKDVVVVGKTRDKYGRSVGHVLIDGRDVNLEMLEEGMAWHYKKYDKNVRLSRAEEEARTAGRGLWQDRNPVPPWDWRKSKNDRRRDPTRR